MERELREALCEDLDVLIRLHDREVDGSLLAALRVAGFPDCLALPPMGKSGGEAYANLGKAVAAIEPAVSGGQVDLLAADYAAIYLTNRIGASPYESVWLDDDHLTCQQSMFELRQIYAAAGVRVADRSQRHDDHLVCQLQYLRFKLGKGEIDWPALAAFIDEHLGYWLPQFAERVTRFCATEFYAGLAQVTYVWLERFREILAEIHDLPRPERDALTARIRQKLNLDKAEVAAIKFMPGRQGPSW